MPGAHDVEAGHFAQCIGDGALLLFVDLLARDDARRAGSVAEVFGDARAGDDGRGQDVGFFRDSDRREGETANNEAADHDNSPLVRRMLVSRRPLF